MKGNIFIPKECKVGFNERTDTYTGLLVYVIDHDGKKWGKNHPGLDESILMFLLKNTKEKNLNIKTLRLIVCLRDPKKTVIEFNIPTTLMTEEVGKPLKIFIFNLKRILLIKLILSKVTITILVKNPPNEKIKSFEFDNEPLEGRRICIE